MASAENFVTIIKALQAGHYRDFSCQQVGVCYPDATGIVYRMRRVPDRFCAESPQWPWEIHLTDSIVVKLIPQVCPGSRALRKVLAASVALAFLTIFVTDADA